MKILKPWLPPVLAAAAVIGLMVYIAAWRPRNTPAKSLGLATAGAESVAIEVCEGYPWDDPNSSDIREMNVIVENEGVYIGTQCIPYRDFRVFMIKHAKHWRPHHVIIHGPIDGRFGRGVEVFDTLRLLNLCPIFNSSAVAAGTRLPAIKVWKNGMDPDDVEQADGVDPNR